MFRTDRRKAFTLLELIVVVVVLGILAALAIPSFSTVKQSAADKIAIQSAESVVRNAKALAAFDGAALSDTYVDQAGSEIGVKYNSSTNTVTVTSSGLTGTAAINATTGAITLGSSSSTPSGPVTVNATAFGWGSSNYYNGTFVRWAGSTSTETGWSGNQAAFDVLKNIKVGDSVTFSLSGESETHVIANIVISQSPTSISVDVTFDSPWTGFADTFNADPGTVDTPTLGQVTFNFS